MSNGPEGPEWWRASNGRRDAPEHQPILLPPPPPPQWTRPSAPSAVEVPTTTPGPPGPPPLPPGLGTSPISPSPDRPVGAGAPSATGHSRNALAVGGIIVAIALLAIIAVIAALTSGDDDPLGEATGPATSPTVTAATSTTGPRSTTTTTTQPATTTTTDPDVACRTALTGTDPTAGFSACTAEQYARLQPEIAPDKAELVAGCQLATWGPACAGIPTTGPPPP